MPWNFESAGVYQILSRATTASGATQPSEHDSLNGGYLINFSPPITIEVTAGDTAIPLEAAQTLLYDMNAFAESNADLPLDLDLEFSEGAGI